MRKMYVGRLVKEAFKCLEDKSRESPLQEL